VPKHGTTITHEILGAFGAARVFLRPASQGTGVIAGGGVRAVLELAGIRDVLAKSLGTTNPINMARATVDGLKNLRRPEDVARARGKTISEVLPYRRPVEPDAAPEVEEQAPLVAPDLSAEEPAELTAEGPPVEQPSTEEPPSAEPPSEVPAGEPMDPEAPATAEDEG